MTVSLHCGIRLTNPDVVGLLMSSRVSRIKSLTEITLGMILGHFGLVILYTKNLVQTCLDLSRTVNQPVVLWLNSRSEVVDGEKVAYYLFHPSAGAIMRPKFRPSNSQIQ